MSNTVVKANEMYEHFTNRARKVMQFARSGGGGAGHAIDVGTEYILRWTGKGGRWHSGRLAFRRFRVLLHTIRIETEKCAYRGDPRARCASSADPASKEGNRVRAYGIAEPELSLHRHWASLAWLDVLRRRGNCRNRSLTRLRISIGQSASGNSGDCSGRSEDEGSCIGNYRDSVRLLAILWASPYTLLGPVAGRHRALHGRPCPGRAAVWWSSTAAA